MPPPPRSPRPPRTDPAALPPPGLHSDTANAADSTLPLFDLPPPPPPPPARTAPDGLPLLEPLPFPSGPWYFEPRVWAPHRFILGRPGRRPLVCIGINPSTARPGALDPTLKSVERLALRNGHDSWIMFNVSSQRATDPNNMALTPSLPLHAENLRWFRSVLTQTSPVLWAAWGTLISKRPYLPKLLADFVQTAAPLHIPWVTFGPLGKAGHPHHPLYLRADTPPVPFDITAYLQTLS